MTFSQSAPQSNTTYSSTSFPKEKKQPGLFPFQVTSHAEAVENSVELSSNGESSYNFERERVYAKINETQASLTTVLAMCTGWVCK